MNLDFVLVGKTSRLFLNLRNMLYFIKTLFIALCLVPGLNSNFSEESATKRCKYRDISLQSQADCMSFGQPKLVTVGSV